MSLHKTCHYMLWKMSMPVKYTPKVKLELFTTLKCQNWDKLCVPFSWESLGFYSHIGLDPRTCGTSLFLMGKTLINTRIFYNSSCIRISFMLGLYKSGLIVCYKYLPFKVPWRLCDNELDATWPLGLSMPGPS